MVGPVPPLIALLLLAVVLAAGRYAHLRWRDRRRERAREQLRQRVAEIYARLVRDEARDGRLPFDQGPAPEGWRYRPMPGLQTDRRLLLLHEDEPRQLLPAFPGEDRGRTVVFADGRVEIFAEEAFERLLVGDNVLRTRLDLPELDAQGKEI